MTHASKKSVSGSSFETIQVQHAEVACDGGKGQAGHPRVFLHIDRAKGHVVCPYCSRDYVLDPNAAHH